MQRCILPAIILLTLVLPFRAAAQFDSSEFISKHSALVEHIIAASRADSAAYNRLAYMCDTYGHRLSGSEALEKTIDWILDEMRRDGLQNVRGEEVMVPHWVRGHESCVLVSPRRQQLPMLGLGGSIATPPEGITAEMLVVGSYDELARRAAEAEGKIVLYNVPFTTYGETVNYRVNGAVKAAEAGAVASLIRSVGPYSMKTPHTGGMRYNDSVREIPHAAITVEDAEMLQRMADRGEKIVVTLQMEATTLPDARSRNVVAELTGTEKPEEIVVFGGHIDSWDVGQGAMDDGSGCMVSWQALNLLKGLGLRPRRTLRLVFWTNEENGLRGGKAYAEAHKDERHVLALETDYGVFTPIKFGVSAPPRMLQMAQAIGSMLAPVGVESVRAGGGGADIGPLAQYNVPLMGLEAEGERYFWYHHTEADTMDKLNPDEMNNCVAAIAAMIYIIANQPGDIP